MRVLIHRQHRPRYDFHLNTGIFNSASVGSKSFYIVDVDMDWNDGRGPQKYIVTFDTLGSGGDDDQMINQETVRAIDPRRPLRPIKADYISEALDRRLQELRMDCKTTGIYDTIKDCINPPPAYRSH